jgi:transposase
MQPSAHTRAGVQVMKAGVFAGIDVAQAWVDVAVRGPALSWRAANDPRGISEVAERLRELRPELVVVEATGGVELALVGALAAAGLPVAIVNPQVAVRELGAVLTRRRQVWEMLTAEQHRLRTAPAHIRSQIQEHLGWLKQQLRALDREPRPSSGPAAARA